MKLTDGMIVSHQEVAKEVYEMVLTGDFGISKWFSGQFVQVKTPNENGYLRRPFSIVDAYDDKLIIVYRLEGEGTRAMSLLKPGDTLNILGPMGNTFPEVHGKKVALLGGGIGVVPLYGLGRKLKEKDNEVHSFMGYLNRESIIYQDAFDSLGELKIATMDGSEGVKGNVLDIIKDESFDYIFACGPHGMLRAIDLKYRGQEAYVSLEARMACGYGVCNACVCKRASHPQKTSLICKEGPVFKAGEVEL